MNRARGLIRVAITLLVFGATALGVRNVASDNSEVRGEAEAVICGAPACGAHRVREERSPFAQTFTFQESPSSSSTLTVRCSRQWILLGNYTCSNHTPMR